MPKRSAYSDDIDVKPTKRQRTNKETEDRFIKTSVDDGIVLLFLSYSVEITLVIHFYRTYFKKR